MIKLLNIRQSNGVNVTADLISDTKAEVTANAEIDGLNETVNLQLGSTLITASGDYAILNSSGEWVWWQNEDEETPNAPTASVTPQAMNLNRNNLKSESTFDENPTYVIYQLPESVEIDVELPALSALSGTNTLSVGTAVQPSKVDIQI